MDLGGIHVAVDGRLVIDTNGNGTPTYPVSPPPTRTKQASTLRLQDGTVYEIVVFQTERQSNASTLQVTFPAFNTASSECTRM